MYEIAILDDQNALPIAPLLERLLNRSGFGSVTRFVDASEPRLAPALTLGANQTRILHAAGIDAHVLGHAPDRAQWRLSPSAYLIAELPLGAFYQDRYGAPLINADIDAISTELPTGDLAPWTELSESAYALVVDARTPASETEGAELFVSVAAPTAARANTTWFEGEAIAWHCSTPTPGCVLLPEHARLPSEGRWHAQLQAAAHEARPTGIRVPNAPREHWTEGKRVYLGQACSSAHPISRETWLTGWEDAWVLSRMLENYEEDIADGLSEYQRYRRPRAQKIDRTNTETMRRMLADSSLRRGLSHLNRALSTRFLPEIAMQRIDWLYQYDCIRGFR